MPEGTPQATPAVKSAGFGKDRILFIRKLGSNNKATRIAYQVEHELEYKRKSDSEATKDGSVVTSKGLETTLSLKAISGRTDIDLMLENAVRNDDTLEFWDVDLKGKPSTPGKLPAKYMRGKLSSWKVPADVEKLIEQSAEVAIIGKPVDGEVTLTVEQSEELAYQFTDINPS